MRRCVRSGTGGSGRPELAPGLVSPEAGREAEAATPEARGLPSRPLAARADALRVSQASPGKGRSWQTRRGAGANFRLTARPAWGAQTLGGPQRSEESRGRGEAAGSTRVRGPSPRMAGAPVPR